MGDSEGPTIPGPRPGSSAIPDAGGWWRRWMRPSPEGAATRAVSAPTRWVVLDVEATGLDAHRDRLLAVAAVAVRVPGPGSGGQGRAEIVLGDAFECVLREDPAAQPPLGDQARANILLHGIGLGERRHGVDPLQAMQALQGWLAGAPVLGFHVAFDETLLQRQRRVLGLPPLRQPFVDLEHVAQALTPQAGGRSLDDWMARLGVQCAERHRAAADALATAEVLLHLWPALRREQRGRAVGLADLQRLARARKWLAGPAR